MGFESGHSHSPGESFIVLCHIYYGWRLGAKAMAKDACWRKISRFTVEVVGLEPEFGFWEWKGKPGYGSGFGLRTEDDASRHQLGYRWLFFAFVNFLGKPPTVLKRLHCQGPKRTKPLSTLVRYSDMQTLLHKIEIERHNFVISAFKKKAEVQKSPSNLDTSSNLTLHFSSWFISASNDTETELILSSYM